jgi:pimeloyl-ACP methyl ester carboxylesterase
MGLLARTAPELASRVAADLFMTPRRFNTPPREQTALADAVPFEVRLGTATRIQAWRWGRGPLVLLVHGWEGRGSQLAPFARPLVEAGYSVVAFDGPGHGASSGKRSSLPHFAFAVRSIAESLGKPHAVLAHSLGCAAATLALRDGLTTQRVVFIAPPLNPSDYVSRFGEILGLDGVVLDRMKDRLEERFLRKWSDYSLEATAREMTAPLLVIHDREDNETRHSEGSALAAAWNGARMISTSGLGHRRILRDEKVIEAAVQFIAAT